MSNGGGGSVLVDFQYFPGVWEKGVLRKDMKHVETEILTNNSNENFYFMSIFNSRVVNEVIFQSMSLSIKLKKRILTNWSNDEYFQQNFSLDGILEAFPNIAQL